ncbi:uncharacterized protein LOC104582211 [Brachypodium distachyon]|uniref:uncharacterized protein LOC104582211 n=1 Tax=Brachypodium distachyon TaxID=15368 RepID=UPI00052FEC83|nr:uncharacterized protein LOC104582211 [Brachypodium distachyon]|eukprot:XP_010229890.1 uncharacterized protein LOC104582211 [Brachypodium distachyon]
MVGPLRKSKEGGHTLVLVAIDKFSKWIEAMPITNQAGTTAVTFFRSIVFRFGVPHNIITDNGSNFISSEFRNKEDGDTPQLRLPGAWVEELPSVLWSLRTTPNGCTNFTPFFMVYGAEAVLPFDVRFHAPRAVDLHGGALFIRSSA